MSDNEELEQEGTEEVEEQPESRRDTIARLVDEVQENKSAPPTEETRQPQEDIDRTLRQRQRGVDGKFTPREGRSVTRATAAGDETLPATPGDRAPSSWRPEERERWNALPQEVRSIINRREGEIAAGLREASQHKAFAQRFNEISNPYRAVIEAEGSNPLQSYGRYLQTAMALRTSPSSMKAGIVADIMQTFGIPAELLDNELVRRRDGGAPPPAGQPQQQQQFRDPRLDELLQRQEQSAREQQEYEYQQASGEVTEYSGSREFVWDLRHDMASLIEVAARGGPGRPPRVLSLDEAYQGAVTLNPQIARIFSQREAAQRSNTQRSRRASSSLAPRPAIASQGQHGRTSLRGSIEAAMEEVYNR